MNNVDGQKRLVSTHRFAYQSAYGDIEAGHLICHSCDTRACVNPWHLFSGTFRDNVRDSMAKTRFITLARRGENVWTAKLNALNVRIIRHAYAAGQTRSSLARQFRVDYKTIDCIIKFRTWTHVLDE
jgi:hypothetical protein